jgi:hypothetical protein
VSSHPTDCAADTDSGGRARDGVILGKYMVGTLDEELVSEEDGKDICLLVVHTSNSSGDVLTWLFVDSGGVIDLTSPNQMASVDSQLRNQRLTHLCLSRLRNLYLSQLRNLSLQRTSHLCLWRGR